VPYRDLVIAHGFPGPGGHAKMFQRLKERGLDQLRRELVTRPRRERLVFVAGRRRGESRRRASIPARERRGSVIWVSPIINWTAADVANYLTRHNLDRCDASAFLHMSGECSCGAFARPGELEQIATGFPEVAEQIQALEREVAAAGHRDPRCRWGHGEGRSSPIGPLCSSCTLLDPSDIGNR
jgi:3'-phosphoadenosine 5'-phosphosulfate sulfotransferase (PAPS reductase)/FAD synthetase